MRLDPIEQPQTLFLRLAYWFTRRQYGKVLSSLKVIYARKPRLARLARQVARTMEQLSISPELRLLVVVQVARLNDCPFCEDLYLAQAVQKKLGLERFQALREYRTSPAFTERERAVLAFAEEATVNRKVSEATFDALRTHYSETEMVEIVWLVAAENYFNIQTSAFEIESDHLVEAVTAPGGSGHGPKQVRDD